MKPLQDSVLIDQILYNIIMFTYYINVVVTLSHVYNCFILIALREMYTT